MQKLEDILKEREERYGRFIDNAHLAQSLKDIMRDSSNWDNLDSDQKEALEQIASKISRILTGTAVFYSDSWQDIAGYATRVQERLENEHGQ